MISRIKSALKKMAGTKQYQNLIPLKWSSLKEIGIRYHTDKVDRNHIFKGMTYLDIYEGYFNSLRKKKIAILEIGVKGGNSLRTWKAYFAQADVFGLDIDPECGNLEELGIQIAIGSQDDVRFLGECFGADQKFDIIIDDGSHVNRHVIASFEYLFYNRLNPGGIYIIEDLRCSYQALQTESNVLEKWPGMKYNDPRQNFDNNRDEMNDFFFNKIKELDYARGDILSLNFWSMVCVIIKASNV